MLEILFLCPIIGTIILLASNKSAETLKQITLWTTIITFLWSILIWLSFDNSQSGPQMISKFNILPSLNLTMTLGVDGISLLFIILTTFLIVLCIAISWDSINDMVKEFLVLTLVLQIFLFFIFLTLDLLFFYIFFESILIPMYIFIVKWGARKEKFEAALYLFIYTLIGSVFMLLGIFWIMSIYGTSDYLTIVNDLDTLRNLPNWALYEKILFICFFLSFGAKIPLIPLHIWLPKAHVESPLSGSMILAGILLKLGGYGFIRYSLVLFPDASKYFSPLVYTICVIGVIYGSLTTIRQIDLKRVIAYSSVAHMAVVVLGIFSYAQDGIEGSLFLQIAHGLTSPALFIAVTILYTRHHTRIIKFYRGMAIVMPVFAILFFIFTLANLSLPLTVNFIGEFLVLLGVYKANTIAALLATTGVILSAAYSLFLYNRVMFGGFSEHLKKENSSDLTLLEFNVLFILAFLIIMLGIFPNIILTPFHGTVGHLMGLI